MPLPAPKAQRCQRRARARRKGHTPNRAAVDRAAQVCPVCPALNDHSFPIGIIRVRGGCGRGRAAAVPRAHIVRHAANGVDANHRREIPGLVDVAGRGPDQIVVDPVRAHRPQVSCPGLCAIGRAGHALVGARLDLRQRAALKARVAHEDATGAIAGKDGAAGVRGAHIDVERQRGLARPRSKLGQDAPPAIAQRQRLGRGALGRLPGRHVERNTASASCAATCRQTDAVVAGRLGFDHHCIGDAGAQQAGGYAAGDHLDPRLGTQSGPFAYDSDESDG
ncbi:hypothetical protein OSTOST_14156 [Ostertagia ostertagi]